MIDAIYEEIEIKASPETVFEAWATPQQMLEWWGEEGFFHATKCTSDVRPGGKWRMECVNAAGKHKTVEGEYLRVESPKYLSFTWKHDWDESNCITTVELTFQKTAKGTLLKLKHHGFTSQTSRDDHKNGWPRVLGWLCGYTEKKSKVSN